MVSDSRTEGIGRKRVKDVMRRVFEHVKEDDPIEKVLAQLEREEIDTVPVMDKNGRFVGDISERNLLKLVILPGDVPLKEITGIFGRNVDMQYFATKAGDLTNRHELTVGPEDTVSFAAVLMLHHGVNSLPVVEKGKIVGILTELHILEEIYGKKRKVARKKKCTS